MRSAVFIALFFCAAGQLAAQFYPSTNAKKIQGVPVSPTAPTNGQVQSYNSTSGQYEPSTITGGSSGVLYCVDAGSTDTYACNLTTISLSGSTSTALTAYTAGLSLWFKANTVSSVAGSAPTININSLGARNLVTEANASLSDGYISTSMYYQLVYDGTSFRVAGSSNVLPNATGYQWAKATSVDGSSLGYTFRAGVPSSGAQILNDAGDAISADREYVEIAPDASRTYTSTPTIADGAYNGERTTITNTTNFNVTLQDEAVLTNSNLCLGGSNLTLAYRGSVTLVWNSGLSCWVRAVTVGSSSDRTILSWAGTPVAIGTNTISYAALSGSNAFSTTERSVVIPQAGTLSRLYVYTTTSQSAGDTQVCTVRVNHGDPGTTLTVTMAAGAAAGPFSDTSTTMSVSAGDRLSLMCDNNSASGSGAAITSFSVMFTF
jgi:hypothetical protein